MNPQGGESSNNQATPANAAVVVDRPLDATVEPNASASNPLDNLEGVVAAAQEAAAQPTTAPVQVETPKTQFENQFGSGVTPPVTEALAKPEENPQATFVQDIKAAVNKLEEATREKTAV